MGATLAAVLRAEPIQRETVPFHRHYSACGGKLRYAAVRNDFLDTRTTRFEDVHCERPDVSDTRCVVFAKDSILAEFDTLVVNSGAHQMGGGLEAFRTRMDTSSEELTASMKRLHGDDAILVVRNTAPGHWGCTRRWATRVLAPSAGSCCRCCCRCGCCCGCVTNISIEPLRCLMVIAASERWWCTLLSTSSRTDMVERLSV